MLSRNVIFNETIMFVDNPSIDAPIEGEKISMQVEHLIDALDVDNAFVQDTPIAEISPIVNDSSIIEHSSLVVQSPQHCVAISRARRQPKPVKWYIEECNIAYAMSVAEEIKHNLEPSNYSVAITSIDCSNWVAAMQVAVEWLEKNGT
jgi:hypothetical protein